MSVRLDKLSNGLRIVTETMPGSTVPRWVSGSMPAAGMNGSTRMASPISSNTWPSRAPQRRSALQIAEEIEDVGGFINAYTSREATAYYARVLKADVPLALDVIWPISCSTRSSSRGEIEVERGVILQEIGQALDTPDDIVFDWLQEAAYPDQALGRTILGPSERVSGFSREDLAGFVAEHYGPGQMVLSAAGAVDHDAIMRMAEAALRAPARHRAQPS